MATINCVDNSVGVYSTGSTITVTTGNANISNGNLLLPTTTSSVGSIEFNNARIYLYGTRNFIFGVAASNYGYTGTDNTFVCGSSSGGSSGVNSLTSATRISCLSDQGALRLLTSGSDISMVGFGMDDSSTTTSQYSTSMGSTAGRGGGNYNLSLGFISGNSNGSATSNICLINVGSSTSHSMFLGKDGSSSEQVNKCFMAGVNGATVTGSALLISTSSPYQVGGISSTRRVKSEIKDMGSDSDPLMTLRPVTFTYKQYPGEKQFGLIAEEANEVFPDIVRRNEEGEINTVEYSILPSILLNELQKQQIKLNSLLARAIKLLEARNGYDKCC